MKIRCEHCGEIFIADPEDVQLLEEGYIEQITPVCEDCYLTQSSEMDYYSDADSGL